MIKVNKLTKDELDFYSNRIANTFLNEPGCFAFMNEKDATKLFKIILKAGLNSHNLYATSDYKEGFLICWNKKEKPNFWIMTQLVFKMMFTISLKTLLELKKNLSNWPDVEKQYKQNDNYLYPFMIVVRKEFQHQGYFKQIMNFVKEEANKQNCLYFLDTDSELKKDKYLHEGMQVVKESIQKNGLTMYLLEGKN